MLGESGGKTLAIFLVIAGLAELAAGAVLFLVAPGAIHELAAIVLLVASVITFGIAELVHIGNRLAKTQDKSAFISK